MVKKYFNSCKPYQVAGNYLYEIKIEKIPNIYCRSGLFKSHVFINIKHHVKNYKINIDWLELPPTNNVLCILIKERILVEMRVIT